MLAIWPGRWIVRLTLVVMTLLAVTKAVEAVQGLCTSVTAANIAGAIWPGAALAILAILAGAAMVPSIRDRAMLRIYYVLAAIFLIAAIAQLWLVAPWWAAGGVTTLFALVTWGRTLRRLRAARLRETADRPA